ncbi:DUF4978 domain-containing protein [Paenibacillus roseipurpureus]|uniref:DUF4978 domain-containing protein n=1 Tax=Paenibacillus roseopurpureus TaxID=2918901 RepID=A0AA96LLQ2_9BACL|nr:DUF4978 domain-containing protein [Paenibacillus sp. MBLB1832]WNR43452.1 DUF4978 domain-containing protein [Paenibacillus sp. MBLB1832]
MRRCKRVLGVVALAAGLSLGGWFPNHAEAAPYTASKLVTNGDGKTYMEVNGNPFLYLGIQNLGRIQTIGNTSLFATPMPESWLENVFEKTQAAGYKTIQIVVRWSEVEPSQQGTYDFHLIDKYIDWANAYGLYLDIVWMGSNSVGGTKLPGYGTSGWRYVAPVWTHDKNKYWGAGTAKFSSEVFSPWLTGTDAENLHNWEKSAVRNLFNHIASYDTNHRTIVFQVNNEPDQHANWTTNKAGVIGRLDDLAAEVKNSNYVVATRVNLTGKELDGDLNTSHIDFNGADPYTTSVNEIANLVLDTANSRMPYVAENNGKFGNVTSLMLTALVNGGFYDTFQLDDHFTDKGLYDPSVSYVNWTLGNIPALRPGGEKVKRLNNAMLQFNRIIAAASKSNMAGFNIETDNPVSSYDAMKIAGGYTIGFSANDSSVALAVNKGNDLFVASDTAGTTTFKTEMQPVSVQKGYMSGSTNQWVSTGNRGYTTNSDGTYSITYNAGEALRITMPSVFLYEAEGLNTLVSSGDSHASFADGSLSGGMGDKFTGDGIGDYIQYTINVPSPGTYEVRVRSKNQVSRGKFQLAINGSNQGNVIDTYSAANSYVEYSLGTYNFTLGGSHTFKFLITGKNVSSTGYTLGLDYIKLVN